jgi:hypothetical protein
MLMCLVMGTHFHILHLMGKITLSEVCTTYKQAFGMSLRGRGIGLYW